MFRFLSLFIAVLLIFSVTDTQALRRGRKKKKEEKKEAVREPISVDSSERMVVEDFEDASMWIVSQSPGSIAGLKSEKKYFVLDYELAEGGGWVSIERARGFKLPDNYIRENGQIFFT